MPAKEPSLSDLARALGISQLAAGRHAKAVGGVGALGRMVNAAMNHLVAGRSVRTLPGGLPPFIQAAVVAAAEGKAQPAYTSRKPGKSGHVPRDAWKQRQPPTKEEESEWTDEFLAVYSSNVYSFRQHQNHGAKTATLYVTFRAASFNHDNIGIGHSSYNGKRSSKQLKSHGNVHVGGDRPLEPGATYAYYNTPPELFEEMKAAHSRGKFVWDKLRVRGTIHGHRYAYSLVSGQVLPGTGGSYIPRRAAKVGFKTRTLAEIGTGKRGFVTSTLPPSSGGGGFRTRSVRGK